MNTGEFNQLEFNQEVVEVKSVHSMIQTYQNYLDQYQIIGIGNVVNYHCVHTEISYIINQYNIVVANSIQELSVDNNIQELSVDNNILELSVR